MKKTIIAIAVFLCLIPASAQQTKRVLFLGNSYTFANNIPQMLAYAAESAGKNLVFDMNAPGGYYLGQHATNAVSLAKIAIGNWDNVVLQDQSLAMAYPGYFMNNLSANVALDSIIKSHNPCAQTMYFATWGRKNGGTYVCGQPYCDPPEVIVRDYFAMDSDIESHYHFFADSLKSSMAPVGAVWRYIRQNYPSIELFAPDESHPTLAGSYAAACCFYATIFRSDPSLIVFDGGVPAEHATQIRNAAKQVVYDHLLQWNVGLYDDLLGESCAVLREPTKQKGRFAIFPNPTQTMLHFRIPADLEVGTIAIYNSLGILMRSITVELKSFEIDVSDLPTGLYLIVSGDFAAPYKLIKK
ncbi:SGNH/GDSL hydrolase family protein [Flavobacterium caeni]|uniref:Por secretion system C-terminal sorting domain-containing protein n=1 Tax=Flavobacterium caeni TaxID=490189 RepID=A0A1G5CRX2_9FLAO|nr:SGNH/GDSL hydrolase family protein [Flavobacterium caeni]SCY05132.1 Por secretion system C-terminal sorting domain-containing protein [Flavobacterium caeni]